MLKQPRSVTSILDYSFLESDQRQSTLYKSHLTKREAPSPFLFRISSSVYFSNFKSLNATTTKKRYHTRS